MFDPVFSPSPAPRLASFTRSDHVVCALAGACGKAALAAATSVGPPSEMAAVTAGARACSAAPVSGGAMKNSAALVRSHPAAVPYRRDDPGDRQLRLGQQQVGLVAAIDVLRRQVRMASRYGARISSCQGASARRRRIGACPMRRSGFGAHGDRRNRRDFACRRREKVVRFWAEGADCPASSPRLRNTTTLCTSPDWPSRRKIKAWSMRAEMAPSRKITAVAAAMPGPGLPSEDLSQLYSPSPSAPHAEFHQNLDMREFQPVSPLNKDETP